MGWSWAPVLAGHEEIGYHHRMRLGTAFRMVVAFFPVAAAYECQLAESGLGALPDAGADAFSSDVTSNDTAGDVFFEGASEAEAGPIATSPGDLQLGLQLWLRSDVIVLDDAGAVSNWPDQSGLNDTTRIPTAPSGFRPTLDTDAALGGPPPLSFHNSQYLQTAKWADAAVTAPLTIFLVGGQDTPASMGRYFFDSINPAQQCALLETIGLRVYANGAFSSAAGATTGSRAVIAVINAGTAIYNSANTPQVSGLVPTGGTLTGVTIGSYAGLGAFALNGDIAEVAVWARALAANEINALNQYAHYRYSIIISP